MAFEAHKQDALSSIRKMEKEYSKLDNIIYTIEQIIKDPDGSDSYKVRQIEKIIKEAAE